MKQRLCLMLTLVIVSLPVNAPASDDARTMVKLPEMMRGHMLSNMRDHLAALNEILRYLADGKLDKAAGIAEYRLGMSSLNKHGAEHLAKFMPEGMRDIGTSMHKAASIFARKAEEGDVLEAYAAVPKITSACVACHAAYKIN